ncbi:MAG: S-layer homology domain-containing protein, partial [Clostridia bacterium]|nr:S-layer homology domain-containing protein [Clostridia bacterium]
MKFTKRFLAVLISAMIVSTTFAAVPAFADFKDVTEAHNAYTAVNVLSKLGVINGYEGEDGSFSFKPDNNVTRAEFTAMLLRTRGMGAIGSTSLENPPFPDVVTPDVSWAIGNIRTAREMGIINGYDDGTFKPNNNVSYEEAVKMIVCALGYGNMGQDGALWYSRYLASAKTLGFIDGAGGAIGTSATRATIAKMLYNCLEVNLAENDEITSKTILENDLKLTKNIGYIDSNSEISLSSPDSNLRDDEVQIAALNEKGVMETNTYKVENASQYADMLGAEITFYYTLDRNSGFRHLIMASVRNSETLEIPVENVIDSDDSSIKYRKSLNDDSTATVSIAQGSVVVYNGKLFGADKESSTFSVYASEKGASKIPTIGNIKLIDRNGDKKFDVVFIESYEAWFVSSKTTSNYTIVDKVLLHNGNENAKKVLDPDYVNFKDLQGAKSSFSSINANSVVCIMESNSGNGAEVITTVVVCKDVVSGKITATSSKNGYTIGGKNYKISPQARWKNDIAPVHGDTGKFYLDCNGNIVTFIKSETESNQQYGYVTDTYEKMDEFESSLQLWIVTSANIKGKAYTVSDNAKLIDPEGNICQGTEIKDQLDDPDNKKLVKFKTN